MTQTPIPDSIPATSIQHFFGTCAICKRRHQNVGFAPSERHPIKWLCTACLDAKLNLQKAYHMTKRKLDEYERRALADGGDAAGAYLDEIGKTDLAQLHEEEWAHVLELVLTGYADSMREIVSKEIPF